MLKLFNGPEIVNQTDRIAFNDIIINNTCSIEASICPKPNLNLHNVIHRQPTNYIIQFTLIEHVGSMEAIG